MFRLSRSPWLFRLLPLPLALACQMEDRLFAPGANTPVSGPPLFASSGPLTPPSGMVAWWPGDGYALDIVGGNHGTLQNGATFASGMVSQAFSFDGVDDHVSVADDVSLRAIGAITIDFWARFNTVPRTGDFDDTMTLLEKAGDYIVLWRADGPAGQPPGQLTLDLTDACDGAFGLYHLGASVALPTLQSGDFHHFAFTGIDGGASGPEFHFFFDGVEQTVRPSVDPPHAGCGWFTGVTGEFRLAIIASAPAPPLAFDGLIDEVEIFDRALTGDEIAAIADAGSAGKRKDVTICHKGKTLVIKAGALADHLGHGDSMGPCQ